MGVLERLAAALRARLDALPLPGRASSHGAGETAHDAEFRAEAWTRADGSLAHLIVASARGIAAAHAIVRTPDGLAFLSGSEIFDGDAIEGCADALIDAIALRPVDRRDMARLRILPPRPQVFVHDVANLLDQLANNPIMRSRVRGAEQRSGLRPLPPRHPSGLVDVIESSDVIGLHGLAHDGRAPAPPPAARTASTVTVLSPCVFPRGKAGAANRAILAETVLPWYATLRDAVLPPSLPVLRPELWTAEAFAHYAVPGEAGIRRGQAAGVYPGLAPVLANDPGLVALVDAGRPFEADLALTLGRVTDREPPSVARLRRLRTLTAPPPATGPGSLHELLNVLEGLPLERLPVTQDGWARIVPHVGAAALRVSRRHGLDLASLLRGLPPDWGLEDVMPEDDGGGSHGTRGDLVAAAVIGIDDMVARCAMDLVEPCVPGLGNPERVAARLLLEGRTMRSAMQVQSAWHGMIADAARAEDAGAFRRSLEWLPLFQPYTHDSGIVVRCLTSTADLVAEGAHGNDASGVPGLSHCVASYDVRCARGATHVASVATEAGSRRRLSTVEIRVDDATQRLVSVWQHRGHMNGVPPPGAEAAVEALLREVAEGLHPMDPEAAAPRSPPETDAGPFDPALAFEAWRPLMTRGASRAGPGGLLSMAGAVAARPAA